MDLIQPLINGILLGIIYAVVGVGLSMIFGIMRLVNLAHGDLMILASYLTLVLVAALGISPYLALVMVIPAMFTVGFLLQKFILNRVLDKGMEPPLIVAFGVSIILQNALLTLFSPDARSLETSLAVKSIHISQSCALPVIYLVGCLMGLVVIGGILLFFRYNYLGLAIRAASDDAEAAQFMGVDTQRIFAYAMGLAMLTASVAGVVVGSTFTFFPDTGPQYLIIAFGVVIIGGVSSLAGTLVGGVILGLAQVLGAHFLGPGYQLLSGYLILLTVLTIRPQGIFGKVERMA